MPLGDNQLNNPVTDEERQKIREWHAEGVSRNEIGRRLGRSHRTVTIHANAMGLHFDRTMTEQATAARNADLAERRSLLAEALQSDAERLTEQLWEPGKIYAFGGKNNTYAEKDVEQPPAMDKKNLMAAAGIAIEKSLKLVPPADDAGADDARSMLGQLMTGLKAVYDEHRAADEEAEGESP